MNPTLDVLEQPLRDFGVEARFVDPTDPLMFIKASDTKTRAFFGETLPNGLASKAYNSFNF